MKFPPKPESSYALGTAQDRRVFKKLTKLSKVKLTLAQEKIARLLYSQLERDWRTPLEKFIDKLLK